MLDSLIFYFQSLTVFGKTAILLNVFLFIIAGILFSYVIPGKQEMVKRRIKWLRIINLMLLAVYLIDWTIKYYLTENFSSVFFKQISQTGLVLLLMYLFVQFSHAWSISRYGKERNFNNETIKSRTYQSEMTYILVLVISVIVSILLLINIWNVTSWLQATGVIGGLLVVLFATKEAWAHDAVNGLILLYNGEVVPGVVCRIEEMNILAVTRKVSLTQTVFLDVIQKHNIIVPNSKLRNCKIEALNKPGTSHWNDYVEFNIGYETPSETVEAFIAAVWLRACEFENALDEEKQPKIVLINTGDHAIQWRINYPVSSVYRIKQVRYALMRAAFDLQKEFGLSLATPLTHQASVHNALAENH
ncbi:hypothetical protein [Marinicella sp. W31]|uniref:hypothetical protein n=1 Tax=Marinicella sp. W31 TaxID=3023713 RepID=UPI003756A075